MGIFRKIKTFKVSTPLCFSSLYCQVKTGKNNFLILDQGTLKNRLVFHLCFSYFIFPQPRSLWLIIYQIFVRVMPEIFFLCPVLFRSGLSVRMGSPASGLN